MLKSLLVKNLSAIGIVLILCSFVIIEFPKFRGIDKNELEYEDNKITLKFGGYEEFGTGFWFGKENINHFMNDIYLSDIDLQNATVNTQGEIVLQLTNYMAADQFMEGIYEVKPHSYQPKGSEETVIFAQIHSENGEKVQVESGKIKYSGKLPDLIIEFDLKLSNGEKLSGNFDRKLEDFKYYF